MLFLKIRIVTDGSDVIKTLEFDESMLVSDACTLVCERALQDATDGGADRFGLLKPDEEPSKCVWLDMGRTLEYYRLKSGDLLEYRSRVRPLQVRTMDGTVHSLSVDDSLCVGDLTKLFAESIGLPKNEEFSFTVDEETLEKIMRRQSQHNTFSKFEKKLKKLKKKSIITDDEVNWLNPDKTLREQDIAADTVVGLRKRLFFPDQDRLVDRGNPVLLNMIYEQCKVSVVNGTHPCTREEAIHLAALQCVITGCFGSPGTTTFTTHDYLPEPYAVIKGIEALVRQKWQEQGVMAAVEAKVQYVQKCSSLPTYGVTYFLVKGTVGGRKGRSHLLGIASTAISQATVKGKDDIIKTWPLTIVKKFTATDDTFTLEFGDYPEPTYTVKTIQGEVMQQLIDGYISLTLKERRPQRPDTPEDEDVQLVESVNPKKAGKVLHLDDEQGDLVSRLPPRQQPQLSLSPRLIAALQQLIRTIESARQSVSEAPDNQKPIDPDATPNEHISSSLANMLAFTASIILCTQVEPLDVMSCSVIASAITTISNNFSVLVNAVRVLCSLPLGDDSLLQRTIALGVAAVSVFNAAHPEEIENRQQLFASGRKMAVAGDELLMLVNEQEVDRDTHEALIQKTNAVSAATITLISVAKKIAALSSDQDMKNNVIMAAKELALTTQGLVACTKVLAPCINQSVCEDQLLEACNLVLIAIEKILKACQAAGVHDEDTLAALRPAATGVIYALRDFMAKVKEVTKAEEERVEVQSADSLGAPRSFTQSMSKSSVTRSIAVYAKVGDNMQGAVDELTETLREGGSLQPAAVASLYRSYPPQLPPIAASPDPPSTPSSPTPPPTIEPQPSSPPPPVRSPSPVLRAEPAPSPRQHDEGTSPNEPRWWYRLASRCCCCCGYRNVGDEEPLVRSGEHGKYGGTETRS